MNSILKTLPNGRKSGFSGSPYELYKYCTLEYINLMLCQLITHIIRNGIIPYHFNIALVTPLIKDPKKPRDCANFIIFAENFLKFLSAHITRSIKKMVLFTNQILN